MSSVFAVELTTENEGIREFEYELFNKREDAVAYFSEQLAEWAFSPADRVPGQKWLYSYGWDDGESQAAELNLIEKEVK